MFSEQGATQHNGSYETFDRSNRNKSNCINEIVRYYYALVTICMMTRLLHLLT